MVVCLCKGVNDKEIKGLVKSGALSLREVMAQCQAGGDCGTCIGHLRTLIEEAQREEDELREDAV